DGGRPDAARAGGAGRNHGVGDLPAGGRRLRGPLPVDAAAGRRGPGTPGRDPTHACHAGAAGRDRPRGPGAGREGRGVPLTVRPPGDRLERRVLSPWTRPCRPMPLADAALIQLGRLGWSAGEAGLVTARGRLERLLVATKEGRTVRAEGVTAAEAWAMAMEQAGLDGDRNGPGQGG